jgi:hypothetical protein
VQILVVVANSQVRPLTTDVRKVFDAIVISIEWVDLEASPNWSKMGDFPLCIIPKLLKRKKVKIPLRRASLRWWCQSRRGGEFWICEGDLNKRHDGRRDPTQSFLFCIKAKKKPSLGRDFWGRQKKAMELHLLREVVFTCLNNWLKSKIRPIWQSLMRLKNATNSANNVSPFCPLKNDVKLFFYFSFSVGVVPITASGPLG